MFEMAMEKADSEEVKAIAHKMADDQKQGITELNALRDQLKPDAPEAINMDMPGMKPMDMSMLENATGHELTIIL